MTPVLRIAIVEDEAIIAQNLFELVTELGYEVFEPAGNYSEGLELIENYKPDLLLLDIRLGKNQEGIDLGRIINEKYKIPFIYITANSDRETVQSAKLTSPAAYIIKPFTKNDLYAAIEIASIGYESRRMPQINNSNIVFLKEGNVIKKINRDDILFVESEHVYVKVYTSVRSFLYRCGLQQFLEELNHPDFIQTHRSYFVNMQHVNEINQNYIRTENYKIPVSRSYRNAIKQYIEKDS